MVDPFRSKYYDKLANASMHNSTYENTSTEEARKSVMVKSVSAVLPSTAPLSPIKKTENSEEATAPSPETEKVVDKFEDPSGDGYSLNMIQRNGDEVRMAFISKLIEKGFWQSVYDKPKTHQTGFVTMVLIKNSYNI